MQRRAGSRPIQSTKLGEYETKLGEYGTKLGEYEAKLGEYETKLGEYGVCQNAWVTFLQMYQNCSKCAIFNPRRIWISPFCKCAFTAPG